MKKLLIPFTLCILIAACQEAEPTFCERIDCGPNATCNQVTEVCDCDPYYEGDLCEIEIRAAYIDFWGGVAVCDYNPTNNFNADVNISPGLALDVVKIQSDNILSI